eukprot:CAMPEP_0194420604 /NCGR_PEP_ID=MMETSP0176-20130528/19886_1 /TAXON_ID=216777 /ORGANISM="Proboscia alata, Strain PI-D3" /LENGTH=108 /DNA_ID=CAMNT_0039228299 /DNA_START=994 /DNA_END=1317 /DNA_ORIENTATION=+
MPIAICEGIHSTVRVYTQCSKQFTCPGNPSNSCICNAFFSGFDLIAKTHFPLPAIMKSETIDIAANSSNGATEPGKDGSDTTILVATKLNMKVYLQTISVPWFLKLGW